MGDHTETVEIEFDPEKTSFRKLLEIFWKNHNSTSQRGTQYMSAIFYNNEEQRELAEVSKAERQSQTPRPIVTQITKAKIFFDAEDYHQKYMLRHYPDIIEALDLTDEELISSSIAARLNGYLGGNGSVEQFDKECSTFGLSESHLDRVRRKIKSRY